MGERPPLGSFPVDKLAVSFVWELNPFTRADGEVVDYFGCLNPQCCTAFAAMVGSIDTYLVVASFAITIMIGALIFSLAFIRSLTPASKFKVASHKRSGMMGYAGLFNVLVSIALMLSVHFGRRAAILDSYNDRVDFNITTDPVCANNSSVTICNVSASACLPTDPEGCCTNGLLDFNETGTDCGCACNRPCSSDSICTEDCDCPEGFCCQDGVCSQCLPSCMNGILDGDETDVDCGGACSKPTECKEVLVPVVDCAVDKISWASQRPLARKSNVCDPCAGLSDRDRFKRILKCDYSQSSRCREEQRCAESEDCDDSLACFNGLCFGCLNGVRDGDETDVDCGGRGCAKQCQDGKHCAVDIDCASGICSDRFVCARAEDVGMPVADAAKIAAMCSDGMITAENFESDVDCGGPNCRKCELGEKCAGVNTNCATNVCDDKTMTCVSCSNGIRDGDEACIDGGGLACAAQGRRCANGTPCRTNGDCASFICDPLKSLCASEFDGIKSLFETDVDCGGGTHLRCGLGQSCQYDSDCQPILQCDAGACVAMPVESILSLSPAHCFNRRADVTESCIDGGGDCLTTCGDGAWVGKGNGAECTSGYQANGQCASCQNGILDGWETSIDCGGPDCHPCPDKFNCVQDDDCESLACENGTCVSCFDGIRNNGETDIDCGGPLCKSCIDGSQCRGNTDCATNWCANKMCSQPPQFERGTTISSVLDARCYDGILNGNETDIDCGGPLCKPCAGCNKCGEDADCVSGICSAFDSSGNALSCVCSPRFHLRRFQESNPVLTAEHASCTLLPYDNFRLIQETKGSISCSNKYACRVTATAVASNGAALLFGESAVIIDHKIDLQGRNTYVISGTIEEVNSVFKTVHLCAEGCIPSEDPYSVNVSVESLSEACVVVSPSSVATVAYKSLLVYGSALLKDCCTDEYMALPTGTISVQLWPNGAAEACQTAFRSSVVDGMYAVETRFIDASGVRNISKARIVLSLRYGDVSIDKTMFLKHSILHSRDVPRLLQESVNFESSWMQSAASHYVDPLFVVPSTATCPESLCSSAPTFTPSYAPTLNPTESPSLAPSSSPTTLAPTSATPTTGTPTTRAPTTGAPTTKVPTETPSTVAPSSNAPTTGEPTEIPTTKNPTLTPTASPSSQPTTATPTTATPTTATPTTEAPSANPTFQPTAMPTNTPTHAPVVASTAPTRTETIVVKFDIRGSRCGGPESTPQELQSPFQVKIYRGIVEDGAAFEVPLCIGVAPLTLLENEVSGSTFTCAISASNEPITAVVDSDATLAMHVVLWCGQGSAGCTCAPNQPLCRHYTSAGVAHTTLFATLKLQTNSLRACLHWRGESHSVRAPKDLDLMLAFPVERSDTASTCIVSSSRRSCGNATFETENDRGGDFGPESILIRSVHKTVYTFFLRNFGEDFATESSGAVLSLDGHGFQGSFPISSSEWVGNGSALLSPAQTRLMNFIR